MSWTALHIASYGGNINHFAMTGDSAGGNLTINCAYDANKGILQSLCNGQIPIVDAISVLYPVVDPTSFFNNRDKLLSGISRQMAGSYTGGTPEQYPDRYAAIASAPPTFIFVGQQDHLVPREPAFAFAQQALKAGIKTKIAAFPYGDHAFIGLYNSIGDQAYRQLTQQWFKENGLFAEQ